MRLVKEKKFTSLRNEFATVSDSTAHVHQPDKKIVVTIPEDLILAEAMESVLNKGLTFIPVNTKVDEYQVKADCEKYYQCLRLKAHFHNESTNATVNEENEESDTFAKFNMDSSRWSILLH